LAELSSTLAETSPALAARLAATLSPGHLQDETALTIVLEWGRNEPDIVAEWVKTFPAGSLREQALCNLTSFWASQSPDSTPVALLAWPKGPERDRAIRHYLDELFEVDPARGVEVLPAISQDDLRQEETERLVQHWLMRDPSAAQQWLAQASIQHD